MNIEQILAKMTEITSLGETETRSLSDEEVTQYEALEADLKAAQKTVEIRSRTDAYKAPNTSGIINATVPTEDAETRAFDRYLHTGTMPEVETRAQSVGTTTAGGYTVPAGFRQQLTERKKKIGGLAAVAQTINTDSGNTISWPTIDDTANSGAITAENASFTGGADFVFGQKQLGAYKYTTLGAGNVTLKVSVELLQDSAFDVNKLVADKFGQRLARKQADDFAKGTGVTMPLGITTTTGDYFVASGLANTPTFGNLLQAVHGVDPEYRTNARWVMNDATLMKVQSVVDTTGRPMWTPLAESGLAGLNDSVLLGYPVTIDQSFPNLDKDHNGIVFGDISEAYIIRYVQDTTVIVDPYTAATNGQVAYSGWERADGTIQNRNAYVTISGGL